MYICFCYGYEYESCTVLPAKYIFYSASDLKDDGNAEEDTVDEEEYYGWNELRLHPMIMKSIYRLKFKEPTPIQKACIPAAAHQGKVGIPLSWHIVDSGI